VNSRWQDALPKPVAFVFSGGAALGAIQVGMLKALYKVGLQPGLVVGASVGALNGAVVAERPLGEAIEALEAIWCQLGREDVFPGNRISQVRHLIATRVSFFPNDGLAELCCRMLGATRFEQLRLPFGALATELLTNHGALFTEGELHPALLASTAIPGVYPPVEINEVLYVDGALTAHLPLSAAVQMGAASLVVLDAGETCHLSEPPRHAAEMFAASLNAALRQRVRVEAPAMAANYPVLYLPTPCPISRALLDFTRTPELIEQAEQISSLFLADAPIPVPGAMTGAPHFHGDTPMHNLTKFVKA
jgi:NTE family protein